jgi:Xaa-Pro dipeptidase
MNHAPSEFQNADLDFDLAEYARRVVAVRQAMDARGADLLLVDQFEHLVYLFGYLPTAARYQGCLLPLDGPPHMIVRALDVPTFRSQSWVDSYSSFDDDADPISLVADWSRRLGTGRGLAVETDSHFLTVQRYQGLQTALRDVNIVDFAGVLWELRLIKSPAELRYLRLASAIADTAAQRAIAAAVEGHTERDVAIAAYTAGLELGADNGRIALFAYGKSSDNLHGRLGLARLEPGNMMHIETVPQVRGYSARIMRPVVIGNPSPEDYRVAERLIAIQDQQIAAMHPGALAADVDRVCRDQVLEQGLREDYPNTTGYTLGYHATPRTSDLTRALLPSARWRLESGQVFHVYTWARGMAFSETVLVTERGPERLTKTDRRLFTGGSVPKHQSDA